MPKRGAKKLPSGLEDQKRAGSKNFWCNLGKALGPPSGHPRKFLIHAQSWLKPAVDFPLNRNFRCPKRPPLGSERVFFKLGYLGVRYCPPWPSFVKIRRPPSVQSGPVRAGKPVKKQYRPGGSSQNQGGNVLKTQNLGGAMYCNWPWFHINLRKNGLWLKCKV